MRMCYIGKKYLSNKQGHNRDGNRLDNIHLISNYEDKTMKKLIQSRDEKLQQYRVLDEKIRELKKAKTDDLEGKLTNQEKTINKLKKEREEKYIKILEKSLQRLLIKFPQIIEPDLLFLDEYYKLGNSNWEGDLLFSDLDDKKVNIEIKVKVPSYNTFKEQLVGKYIPNIDINKERLMYIAPRITEEQRDLCREYNIEWKEININEILNSWK